MLSKEYLIAEVIRYYEEPNRPFCVSIADSLELMTDINEEWHNLYIAYVTGEFTPSDCRFMWSFVNLNENIVDL